MRPGRLLLSTPAALMLGACTGPQNYMDAAGPAAKGLASLGWLAIVAFSVTTVIVWALLAWIAMRKRGSFEHHAPAGESSGQRWILVGGIAIPVAVLSILFIATLQTLSGYPLAHAHATAPDIRIVGHQWWFEAEYLPGSSIAATQPGDLDRVEQPTPPERMAWMVVHAPTEIHIPVGRPVEIELVSRDVIHSFWIPKLHGKVDLFPGASNRIRILADEPGVYHGECGEYCGAQHAHMRLMIVAQPPEEYAAWLAHQRETARIAANPTVEQGKRLFESAACALCHTVRGTPAKGGIGPDLTHLASRARIAGGMLENNTANLEAWVTDAQSLKPGAQMPSLRQFTGSELRALVAYLQSLE